ncbi:indolepyruvate ferredoxin oxidoreductase [compost metagenome]
MKVVLTGNEAVARGAYEAGAGMATGYPGTPSTVVIEETMRKYAEIYSEWSTNEKVALEVAMGASFAGYRSYAVMKTVGLNVAHDALMSAAQAQTNGGLVLVVSDDAGRISDDCNDCRHYGDSAGVPVLEPSDSQEALEYMKLAFELSERLSLPVIIRLTSITCKTRSTVDIDDTYQYQKAFRKKYKFSYYGVLASTMMIGMADSSNAKVRRFDHDFAQALRTLKEEAADLPVNVLEINGSDIGVITAGVPYGYVKEMLPEASVLKLGLVYPLPERLIRRLADHVNRLYVIEDGHVFLEKEIKSLGFDVIGESLFPKFPESTCFSPELISEKLGSTEVSVHPIQNVPFRLPMNCAGCSHLFVYHILKKHRIEASTDVTCGGIGVFPHIGAFNNAKHMGSSIGMAHGVNVMNQRQGERKYVAVIGDGGFWATGINGMINMVYNSVNSTVIIVDNQCIAMTGGQSLPSGDFGAHYNPENRLSIAEMCRAIGIRDIRTVDAYDLEELEDAVLGAVNSQESSVVIVQKSCLLKIKPDRSVSGHIEQSKCVHCKSCLQLGCLALEIKTTDQGEEIQINENLCVGCKLCAATCKSEAISYECSG